MTSHPSPHDERESTAEAAPHLNRENLVAIIENTLDNIWAVDTDYRILYINENFTRSFEVAFGVRLAPGTRILDTLPDPIRDAWKARYDRALAGERFVFVDRVETRDDVIHVEVSVNPLWEAGRVMGASLFARNITHRVHTEEALLASERRFKELVRHSSDSITILDGTGQQVSVSDAVERILGFSAAELSGIPVMDTMIHPDDQETVREAFLRVLQEGTTVAEYRHRHKDGSWVWLEAHGSNQLDNPDIRGVVINVRDISERKRAEQDHLHLECQLQQAQKMEAVGRLAGGVAHDFNNMLGAIMGFTELALQAEDPATLHANLEEIRRAAERSAELTRQLLAFARRQTVAPQVLDLNRTVERQTRMLHRLIGENVELIWKPGEDLAPVWMDPAQVDQLLTNLCVNARDAIADVGRIRIETANCVLDEAYCAAHPDASCGAHVCLTVIDDGCGMSPQTLTRLFEPFFTTKEVGRGTGLGLAMVHGIVRQNGGHITVASSPGEGTTFRVYLPRQQVTQTPAAVVQAPTPTAAAGSETILLVEDEPAILRLTRKMLERHGYTVLAADSPFEAIRLADLHAGEIHLLLTDVIMPGMNGRDLAVRLTAGNPRLRCLFMSGYTADVIDPHGVLDEDVHFLQKPFSMTMLGEHVRKALDT